MAAGSRYCFDHFDDTHDLYVGEWCLCHSHYVLHMSNYADVMVWPAGKLSGLRWVGDADGERQSQS